MRFSLGRYLLNETYKSISRNKLTSAMSCLTTCLALFLLGVAFLVNLNTGFILSVVHEEMEVQAYLVRDASEKDISVAMGTIQDIPGVVSVKYVSKRDAFEELKGMFQEKAHVLDALESEDLLPASLRVRTDDVEKIPTVIEEVERLSVVEEIVYHREAAKRLAALGRVAHLVSLGGVGVVGAASIMMIGNSIRLTMDSRKDEIAIMKLVGTSDGFVLGPFILEGIVFGVVGGVMGACLCTGLYAWISNSISTSLPFLPVLSLTSKVAGDMLGVLLLTGVVVGVFASAISLRRYLQV